MFLSNGYGIVVLDDGIEVEQVNNKKNISLVDYYYYLFFFLFSCILLQNVFGSMCRPILMTEGHFVFLIE